MYFIKRHIIEKKLKERGQTKKFDYQKAESFVLKKNEDPIVNNSYYFSAHDDDLSIYVRLGLRSNQIETWFVIIYRGEKYYFDKELIKKGKSPLWVNRCLNCYVITFEGELLDKDGKNHHCTFKGAFSSEWKPFDFTSNTPHHRMAVAIAQEKWNKKFFDDLKNIQGQTHYEQTGLLEGKFTLDKKEVKFSLPGVRDHSFGKRDWNYMNNHLWLMAVNSQSSFNYSLVSYPALSILEVGNYSKNKDELKLLKEAQYDLNEIVKGDTPKSLNMLLTLNDDSKLNVAITVLDTQRYHFQNDDYLLIENVASFEINGEKFKGILEIGFNKNQKRYFNGKKIRKIKR